MKRLAILGSTGSIGTQTLEVVRKNKERFEVAAMTCGRNIDLFRHQLKEFKPKTACVESREDAKTLAAEFSDIRFTFGAEGLVEVAQSDYEMLVNSLMGMRGLEPTYYAILTGHDIALANKETLVSGGELIMKMAAEADYKGKDAETPRKIRLLPIDSEHSAIFQCLEGNRERKLKKILLTCSGGPFRGYSYDELNKVNLSQALKHPKWNMGKKITIDSATLMNKGLEVIEAKWLFGVEAENIDILVHPQSIVHSGVMFCDNSVLCQLGVPDMKIPISLALGYPDRLENSDRELDFFSEGSNLTFEKPDMDTFSCLRTAFYAIGKGGSYPIVMNAANEVLVEKFLNGEIKFTDIQNRLEKIVNDHKGVYGLKLEDILLVDKETRKYTEKLEER